MAQIRISPNISRLVVIPVLAVILFSQIQESAGIKCWVCRSDVEPRCSDPFYNGTQILHDCTHEKHEDVLTGTETVMCRKSVQKVNGTWVILRSCAWLNEPGLRQEDSNCFAGSRTDNVNIMDCLCSSRDGCNGAGMLQSAVFLIALSSVLSVIYL